jgi:hypothetical protein
LKAKEGVSCEVCGQQREPGSIHVRDSQIIKKFTVLKCDSCHEKGYEPRADIILAGRQWGWEHVADYVKNDRYVGEPITGKEIIK